MAAAPIVTLYFDPVSPYVWLAGGAVARIEAAGAEVQWQPVLFAAMLNAHGQKGPAEIAAKRLYTFRDVMRQAAAQGLAFEGPPGHPFNPLPALRMCAALTRQEQRGRFARAVLAACWERGADIAARDTLIGLADACELDGATLADAAQQPALKARLAADTERAIADGVFGVPTFRVGKELFWGGDRVEALERHLQGQRIDEGKLAAFLARAPLAQRQVG
ncbi:MAG TPA: 2-hydroxychromene-2-carboxylate isomerase [Telluria sp.]|nr:2-hydroxychromene-2-carboxylate isomerase [Telluria sp.]